MTQIIVCIETEASKAGAGGPDDALLSPTRSSRQALGIALRLKESQDIRVTVVSVGGPEAATALRESLVLGADRGVLVDALAIARAGLEARARAVAKAIERLASYAMVLCGTGGTPSPATFGHHLGEQLGIGVVQGVRAVTACDLAQAEIESDLKGRVTRVSVPLPVLVIVAPETTVPLSLSFVGILEAKDKPLTVWSADDLGLVHQAAAPPKRARRRGAKERHSGPVKAQILEGTRQEQARRILQELTARGLLPPPAEAGKPSLESAAIVLAGGAGVGGPDGWQQVVALAEALNGAVGCTRPAVDEGWADASQMIGQSGTVVSPQVYIGLGISGDRLHMVGLTGTPLKIAVNKDPRAPIFDQVDIGIIDDCRGFLEVLLEELKKHRVAGGHV